MLNLHDSGHLTIQRRPYSGPTSNHLNNYFEGLFTGFLPHAKKAVASRCSLFCMVKNGYSLATVKSETTNLCVSIDRPSRFPAFVHFALFPSALLPSYGSITREYLDSAKTQGACIWKRGACTAVSSEAR